MISRASRMLTMVFDTTHISQIFSTLLYNLVYVSTNKYYNSSHSMNPLLHLSLIYTQPILTILTGWADTGKEGHENQRLTVVRRHFPHRWLLCVLHFQDLLQDSFHDITWVQVCTFSGNLILRLEDLEWYMAWMLNRRDSFLISEQILALLFRCMTIY
jgi:hypothetical protein